MCNEREFAMSRVLAELERYMRAREVVATFLLTVLFLFLSFVLYARESTTELMYFNRVYNIRILYYGVPLGMIGVLMPIGLDQVVAVVNSGEGTFRILWGQLFLDFVLYFLLALFIVYAFVKLKPDRVLASSISEWSAATRLSLAAI